jgi:hypothetical protein
MMTACSRMTARRKLRARPAHHLNGDFRLDVVPACTTGRRAELVAYVLDDQRRRCRGRAPGHVLYGDRLSVRVLHQAELVLQRKRAADLDRLAAVDGKDIDAGVLLGLYEFEDGRRVVGEVNQINLRR